MDGLKRLSWSVLVYALLCGAAQAAPPVVQDVMGMFWFRRQATPSKAKPIPRHVRSRVWLPFVDPAGLQRALPQSRPSTIHPMIPRTQRLGAQKKRRVVPSATRPALRILRDRQRGDAKSPQTSIPQKTSK